MATQRLPIEDSDDAPDAASAAHHKRGVVGKMLRLVGLNPPNSGFKNGLSDGAKNGGSDGSGHGLSDGTLTGPSRVDQRGGSSGSTGGSSDGPVTGPTNGVNGGINDGIDGRKHQPQPDPVNEGPRYRRVGDTWRLAGKKKRPTPIEQAEELLKFLQDRNFGDGWVPLPDLEKNIYPIFLDTPGRHQMSWRTVARGLGKITKRRTKEFGWRVRERDGELMRDVEVQYYVPAPLKKRPRK